ncbi:MAG: DUF4012 domain-containing protein [Patescibacteria group bacterium]
MYLPNLLNHFRKKRSNWKNALIAVAVLAVIFLIFTVGSLGELNELGLRRLTGWPGGQSYLVIFQNDAERRPTGGFITAYATLKFRFGIPSITFGNVYDEKLIQPGTENPDPTIAELIGGPFFPGHGFRDGNFQPDFPATAEELIRLYRLGYPEAEFDGVIAVDFTAFEDLVKATGMEIGEAGLFAMIEQEIQDVDLHNPEELQNRKNFLTDIAKSVIRKAILAPWNYSDVTRSVIGSLDSKHSLLYFRDDKLQSRVREKAWDGALPSVSNSDLLAVNEGNYGGMKSSRYITRDTFYDVDFSEDPEEGLVATANLKVQLAHRGDTAEPISGYYKSYWRIFTPLGTQKISGKVNQTFDDGFRQVWGRVINMNPGEEREIDLKYVLPSTVVRDDTYRLKLVKQPGSGNDFVRVSLKLPTGYLFQVPGNRESAFAEASPFAKATEDKSADRQGRTGLDVKENLVVYQTLLDGDKELELKIIPDTTPPRLAWQEFIGPGLKTIDLRFNEALGRESVRKATFELADMNYRNKRFDSVEILQVRFLPPQNLHLDLRGVTPECREWYELTIDGLSDQHGNMITNKKVTVVQWLDEGGRICDPDRKL